jgi:hypothetical protein
MLQKYSFFCVFALLLTGLHWWSLHLHGAAELGGQVETSSTASAESMDQEEVSQNDLRRELVETMDRLVILENYYYSIYGHYTQVLNHAGFSPPSRLTRHYEIRVVSATKSQFQASAFAEEHGKITDRIWVDQLFRVTANFALPAPSAEYLKFRASQHLKVLRDLEPSRVIPEHGIYTGYFRYEIRRDSGDHPVAVAVGIQSPVLGIQIESEPKKTLLGENREGSKEGTDWIALSNLSGEVGEYAKEWSEFAQEGESASDEIGAGRRLAGLPQSPSDRVLLEDDDFHPPSDRLVIESISN